MIILLIGVSSTTMYGKKNMIPKVNGYFQFRWQGIPEENAFPNTFKFRRGFVGVKGNIIPNLSYKITTNTAKGSFILYDAYLNIKFGQYFFIRLGQFKMPIGMDKLKSGSVTLFPERPLASSFVIDRDLGIMSNFKTKFILTQLGFFNGETKNKIDENKNKDLVARMVLTPLSFLHIGGAYQTGKTGENEDSLQNIHKYGIEIEIKTKSFLLSGEYIAGSIDTTNSMTYYVEAAYMLMFSKKYLYGIQPAIRYETKDNNISLENDANTYITSGINIHFLPKHRIKLNLCYRMQMEEDQEIKDDMIITQLQFKF